MTTMIMVGGWGVGDVGAMTGDDEKTGRCRGGGGGVCLLLRTHSHLALLQKRAGGGQKYRDESNRRVESTVQFPLGDNRGRRGRGGKGQGTGKREQRSLRGPREGYRWIVNGPRWLHIGIGVCIQLIMIHAVNA